MQKEIIIEKFGALKHVDIQLDKQLFVIIGPQASGKSTFGKAVYFCRKIRDYLCDFASEIWNGNIRENPYGSFLKYLRNPFIGYFGTTKHMDNFHIRYYYDKINQKYVDIRLDEYHFTKFQFSPNLSNQIKQLLNEAHQIPSNNIGSFSDSLFQQRAFMTQFQQRAKKLFCDEEALLYIPAGRNLLATIPDLIMPDNDVSQSMSGAVDITQMDLITQEFLRYIKQMRRRFGSRLGEIVQNYVKTVSGSIRNHDVELAAELIKEILKAEYVYDQDGEKLYYARDKWVKLMFGSSGQQEVLWALNCIFLAILQQERTFLIFEEPEAHIFPDAQLTISQLIALLIRSNGSSVLLTTHSPYMLTAMNLLIYSGMIEGKKENEVVPRQCRLEKGVTDAYIITRDAGKFKNIIDPVRGLIDALEIDLISDQINEKMDILLNQKLEEEKERK